MSVEVENWLFVTCLMGVLFFIGMVVGWIT